MEFENKVVIVTGGSSGIGREAAKKFAAKGAKVAIADIDDVGGAESVKVIQDASGEAMFIHADMAKEEDIIGMVKQTVDSYGRLDCALNNAGITGNVVPTVQIEREEFDKVFAVNVFGVWLCMKYQIPEMLKNGGGAIVNTSSLAGINGYPGVPHYSASKHAVLGLTKTAALEHAKDGIRVNAICPGMAETGLTREALKVPELRGAMVAMTPQGRIAQPEEIAGAAVWLCSDEASFTTGTYMIIDGGWDAQ
jgi:NAD(P)-dependent dehydrogenase (short-subunit alcohol dehydrogenase family)